MPPTDSLLPGRSTKPLDDDDVRRVARVFVALDGEVPFKHGPGEVTRCRVFQESDETICEVVFGSDIFPGTNVIDPNSALSMRAAVAHEMSHFHRWKDKTELDGGALVHIDEALTSLDAVQRYFDHLTPPEIRQLVADAMQRLQLFAQAKLAEDVVEAGGV